MTNDLDTLLSSIKNLPIHPRLDAIDDAVFAGLSRKVKPQVTPRAIALVAALSLGVGVAGSMAPAQPVRVVPVFPLGAPAALAPSTLLGAAE